KPRAGRRRSAGGNYIARQTPTFAAASAVSQISFAAQSPASQQKRPHVEPDAVETQVSVAVPEPHVPPQESQIPSGVRPPRHRNAPMPSRSQASVGAHGSLVTGLHCTIIDSVTHVPSDGAVVGASHATTTAAPLAPPDAHIAPPVPAVVAPPVP